MRVKTCLPFLALFLSLSIQPLLAAEGAAAAKTVGEPHVYKTVDHRELHLWVLKPSDWKASDQRPAMVFFHGGGWVSGAPTQFNEHSQHLAGLGVVCVQVEYRLLKGTPAGEPPTRCVQDAKSAMRWVRSHAADLGIDPKRIGAGGGSAGGHLAAFVGMVDGLDDPGDDLSISPKANALVLFNPVLDNGPDQGWGQARVGDRYREFSPAHNISKDDPPAVFFLGTQDKLIPVAVAERFRDGMKAAGVPCDLHLYEGQGHGFFNHRAGSTEYYDKTVAGMDAFLQGLGWIKQG